MITVNEAILQDNSVNTLEYKTALEMIKSNPKLIENAIEELKNNEFMRAFHRNALELDDAELYKLYGDY